MRGLLVALTLVLACGAPDALARTTSVQPGTRVLLVDGQPLTVKGFNYGQAPIGGGRWDQDAATCRHDAQLLGAAGVTVVRIWALTAFAPTDTTYACLDAFHAAGVGVAWTLPVDPPAVGGDPAWFERTWRELRLRMDWFVGHPATLMWLVGNELELECPDATCQDAWFGSKGKVRGLLDSLTAQVKGYDRRHVAGTTTIGCSRIIGAANAPAVDFWAVNLYAHGPLREACGGDVAAHFDALDPRPKIITEWGVERYRCVVGDPALDPDKDNVRTCVGSRSGEDQAAQRDKVASDWRDIAARLATPARPQGTFAGGLVFMWTDQWEKCGLCTPLTHDVAGRTKPIWQPDGNVENYEWWGLTHAQTAPAGPAPRPTTLAYDRLAELWTGRANPAISELSVGHDAACTRATVRWRTSEPATADAFVARELVVQSADRVVADNTLYTPVDGGAGRATTHAVNVPLGGPGRYRAIPRSTAADGRSVTTVPRTFTC